MAATVLHVPYSLEIGEGQDRASLGDAGERFDELRGYHLPRYILELTLTKSMSLNYE